MCCVRGVCVLRVLRVMCVFCVLECVVSCVCFCELYALCVL